GPRVLGEQGEVAGRPTSLPAPGLVRHSALLRLSASDECDSTGALTLHRLRLLRVVRVGLVGEHCRRVGVNLPGRLPGRLRERHTLGGVLAVRVQDVLPEQLRQVRRLARMLQDRKSTRLNSSHVKISYAVFCLKKKTTLLLGMTTQVPYLFTPRPRTTGIAGTLRSSHQ